MSIVRLLVAPLLVWDMAQ